MWIFTNKGFFSIVEYTTDPNKFLVRSRIKNDIEKVFPGYEVFENMGTDYKYRAFIPKNIVTNIIKAEMENITYPNFKNSCDRKRASIYSRVWNTFWEACKDL